MHDEVAHRFELHVAGNGAHRLAVDLEIDQGRQKAAGLHVGLNLAIREGNQLGFLLVAVDDSRNEAFTTDCARGPLACPGPRCGLELHDLGHGILLI